MCTPGGARPEIGVCGDRGKADGEDDLESMAADTPLARPARIAVVDDIVTKGATLLAAASLVKFIFPDADVRVFAMLRTMGLQPEVERIVEPCVGTIHLTDWGEADRQP